jgi:hypothetical protein
MAIPQDGEPVLTGHGVPRLTGFVGSPGIYYCIRLAL